MKVGYTIWYLGSIMILGAYCVVWVHNMQPWQYQDNGSILCKVRYTICYLGSIHIMG